MPGDDPLALGRAALERAAWDDARAHYEQASEAGGGAAWEGLSWAAWWQGDLDATFAARERAFRAYRQAGDPCGAARMAMWLASDHFDFRGDDAVAGAWLRRAEDLVRDRPPCPEHGYNLLMAADLALFAHGDPATALAKAEEAIELARVIGDVGVEVVGNAILGSALVARGDVEDGLRRLDECAALAVAEDFDLIVAPGWALCHTVSVCTNVGDFGRAGQWCRALHTWSARWHGRHFFGVCRTAYGDVLATRGDWGDAEEELSSALRDMSTTRPAMAASTAVRLGRLRASQGDRAARARAVRVGGAAARRRARARRAGHRGRRPVGRASTPPTACCATLGEASLLDRFPALELRGARAGAGGRRTTGRPPAADELERDAARLGTPYMRGRAPVRAGRGRSPRPATTTARAAPPRTLPTCSPPARRRTTRRASRLVLAEALRALGRAERAAAEDRAAREVLARLRATRHRTTRSPRSSARGRRRSCGSSPQGLGDAQIAARLFLSPHTVHRHVANIRAKLRTPSRAAAVAYATQRGLL